MAAALGFSVAVHPFLFGLLTALALTACLIFLRYWNAARDRFFLFFAVAFGCLAANWALMVGRDPRDEATAYIYLLRLVAFLLILAAIIDKNRRSSSE